MTTTLADLLAGVDMEGGENFCDSVYNFLKNQGKDINLLTNSGFGVWSQSDANKGLAELVFKNGAVAPIVGETINGVSGTGKVMYFTLSGGAWDGSATGSVFLGAVTGAYEDNETIAGTVAAVFDVNGDLDIGVKNDPMNDDSVAAVWTDEGGNITLTHLVAEYSVTTLAINQHAWIIAAPLTAGKIYKIELDIKDGNVSGDIQGYFFDGAAQYGRLRTTIAGWASVAWVFECATTTVAGLVGFRIPTNLGGGNTIEIRRFSCYEITPCCTNDADNKAFDGWHKDITIDIYRQHWDATYGKCGSFYSLKMVPTLADDYVIFPLFPDVSDEEYWYKQFCGRPVTIGAWILANKANHVRVYIGDDVSGAQYSDYHTGGGDWEWLELTFTIDVAAIRVLTGFYCAQAGDVDGSTIVYASQPMWVFGWSLGEGMYQPRLQELIWCEKEINGNLLSARSGLSDIAWAKINLEADSDARLPKGCKVVNIHSKTNDSGSAGTDCFLVLRANADAGAYFVNTPAGITDDMGKRFSSPQPCDENGDFDYMVEATAGGTFDITVFRYKGVQVN